MSAPTILISAGEASSDMYAARLAVALRERTGAQLFGMGGPRMAEAGVELIADYHEVAVVGIAEVVHKIPTVVRVQNRLASEAAKRGASLAILVDSPGTHLGVARRLKAHGIPVGYFIGPQVWAWRAGRVRVIKRLVKRMVVIFPFEEKIYRDAGVSVDFVGHPLVDVVRPTMTPAEFATRYGLDAARPIVALLPGSRRNEIAQNYPLVVKACLRLQSRGGAAAGVQFVHAVAPNLKSELFAPYWLPGLELKRVEGATYDALAAADCAIVASGTATVEAALLGTPMVIVYRVNRITAAILRRMIRAPFIGMVNLIAGKCVVPELIQDAFTPAAVEAEVRRLLESKSTRAEVTAGLAEVRAKMGPGGAIERAADVFARML
ncbi:MAG: lipid-A-disaccharide synthase [Candidatus Acidiferrales bacterium]|jgi:lipid-A-disaccharide synthase